METMSKENTQFIDVFPQLNLRFLGGFSFATFDGRRFRAKGIQILGQIPYFHAKRGAIQSYELSFWTTWYADIDNIMNMFFPHLPGEGC